MRPYYNNKVTRWTVIICLLCLVPCTTARAQLAGKYTNTSPLVIVGDSDTPPYEFMSTSDKCSGLNVELMDFILDQMHIPHTFLLTERDEAENMFKNHEADIIFNANSTYDQSPYYNSRNRLAYGKYAIVSRVGSAVPSTVEQLSSATGIVIRDQDRATEQSLQKLMPERKFRKETAKDAIAGVYSAKYDYFIWFQSSLEWKIKELGLSTDLVLTELSLPAEEFCFAGHDKELIDLIDDQFARLQQHGKLSPITDKWLHPEREHHDTPFIAVYIITLILLVTIGLGLAIRFSIRKLRMAKRKVTDVETMMRKALSIGKFSIIEYDVKTGRFTNRHGNMLPEKGLGIQEFIDHLHPDEKDETLQEVDKLLKGRNGIWEIRRRWKKVVDGKITWLYVYGYSIAELDDDGRTRYIVTTVKDVTEEYEEERKEEELATKYEKMFDSTLVAMSFYDKDGDLIDLNQNMRKLCEFDKLGEKFFRQQKLFDITNFKNVLSPDARETFHVCQHMHYPEMGINKYVEVRVMSTYYRNELQYYIVTARDVSAERDMYLKQQKQDADLRQSNETIVHYERELHYLLENSNMWVWRSSLKDRRIILSRSLQNDEFSQTFDEFLDSVDEQFKDAVLKNYGNMEGTDSNINMVQLFKHTPINPKPHWCASNGIPIYGHDGRLTGHFGIVRDVTDLMEAQEQLKQETARAEDSGKLKSVFLANMTHEIRTPLNAIVGFSDLLQMIDNPDERREFIRIIRNNCDMLIRLINDIIEVSNMSQGPLAIEAQDVDFAVAFNDICQTLAQRVQEPGVEFIVDNPYERFMTRIDNGRLQQVITNFTTNAVKYTHQGHIKVGYSYLSFSELKEKVNDPQIAQQMMPFSGIYMYCEDTGAGIPKEKQRTVFDRFVKLNDFVQGTGLGLSICKSIAERCAGRIGVMSEGQDKGSTFWIWIPCEKKESIPNY